MIDLHTHLLPGIDDGPGTVQESLMLAERLSFHQIDCVVCTPHFDPQRISLEEFVIRRQHAASQVGAAPIRLLIASETMLREYLFHYSDLSPLCIEKTGYLLLELPYQRKYDNKTVDMIERLADYYGIQPILAHIDRYPKLANRYKRALKEIGCVFQMNAKAILNPKTRKKALREIRAGNIDVLGSDCHDLVKRPPDLCEAFSLIKNNLGTEYCDKLEYNAACIIAGIELYQKKSYIIE